MATGEGTGTAWALRTRPGRKPAGLRDDHLFVAYVLSLKDRRERSRSLGKPQPCCQGLGGARCWGATTARSARSAPSVRCSATGDFRNSHALRPVQPHLRPLLRPRLLRTRWRRWRRRPQAPDPGHRSSPSSLPLWQRPRAQPASKPRPHWAPLVTSRRRARAVLGKWRVKGAAALARVGSGVRLVNVRLDRRLPSCSPTPGGAGGTTVGDCSFLERRWSFACRGAGAGTGT